MKIFRASLETANFSFEAYATTEKKALALLRRGWNIHRNQYSHANVERFSYFADDAQVREVELGAVYRDGEDLKNIRKA